MNDLLLSSAGNMAEAIRTRKTSAVELLEATFAQVDRVNPEVNAVIWQNREAALAEAQACDQEVADGKIRGPLHGLPVTVKESFDLAGAPTTYGFPEWRNNIRPKDSDAVARYRAAGAIVYGKTNVPLRLVEWQSFNEVYGTTSNPWDLSRTPGGSSGGSAAALATGMAALEVGSDIGSSIRNPSHYCGTFGLKPTWNAVSMQGHKPDGWYCDTDIGAGGPMARSAEDLSLAFDILSGPGRFEATQWQLGLPADPRKNLSEFKVALMLGDDASPVDQSYLNAMSDFADKISSAGATVIRDRLPDIDSEAHFTAYLRLLGAALSGALTDADVAASIRVLDGADEDILRVSLNRAEGAGMSHREWLRLDNERRKSRLAFDAFFEDFDVLLAPVSASAAFKKDEVGLRGFRRIPVNGKQQVENMQLFWSGYSGVAGLPSVVGPMDQIGGLPVGYQAICGHGRDHTALAFARAAEREIIGYTPPPMAV